MSTLKNLFKHTFVYGLATILPRLLTVLLTPILTTYLDTEVDFGEVSLLFTYMLLLNVILTYGMETSFFRFYNEEGNSQRALSTALWILCISTLVFVLISFLGLKQIATTTNIDARYWRWVIGVVAFDTLMVIPFAYMRVQGKAIKYTFIKLINVVISVGSVALFLMATQKMTTTFTWLSSDKVELYFIAFFMASGLTFLLVSKPYFKRILFDSRLLKKMLSYSWPILLAGIAFAVNGAFDKVLLQWMLPLSEEAAKEQVGIYTACYRLAVGMTLYATAFRLGVEPFFFSQAKEKNASEQYAMITKAFVVLGAVALVLYVVLVDIIKPILVTKPSYWEAMDVVPLILFSFFFFGIYQTLSVWYKVTDKTKYGAYISVSGAILTIVINVLFIPTIGYMASAIATCVTYAFMMVLSYVIGKKHMPIPYDLKNICLYLVLSVGFSAVFFYILRDYFGIGSLPLYLAGIAMTAILIGVIWYREQALLLRIVRIRKKK